MSESIFPIPNRREYSRIDAYIPLEYRLVPPKERNLVKSRLFMDVISANFDRMPPLENHPQREYLSLLNKKIDAVIQMMAIQYEGFHSLPFKYVTLSGSGMKFSSQMHFSPGDILEIKVILALNQPVALLLYGEVLHVEKQTTGYYVTVHFFLMDDAIRNYVIRFVFEMEREIIRETRQAE
jgi:hypothetical protein